IADLAEGFDGWELHRGKSIEAALRMPIWYFASWTNKGVCAGLPRPSSLRAFELIFPVSHRGRAVLVFRRHARSPL
ncbi:MAG TPA: hypothetical protein VF614_00360, partial [Chthoniobacteraceae bacterium]